MGGLSIEQHDVCIGPPARERRRKLTREGGQRLEHAARQHERERVVVQCELMDDRRGASKQLGGRHRENACGGLIALLGRDLHQRRHRGDWRRCQAVGIDGMNEFGRPAQVEVVEHERRQCGLATTPVGLPENGTHGVAANPIASALVAEHVSPPPRACSVAMAVAPVGDGSGASDDNDARAIVDPGHERDQGVVGDDDARVVANPLHDALYDIGVRAPVHARHAEADGGRHDTSVAQHRVHHAVQHVLDRELSDGMQIRPGTVALAHDAGISRTEVTDRFGAAGVDAENERTLGLRNDDLQALTVATSLGLCQSAGLTVRVAADTLPQLLNVSRRFFALLLVLAVSVTALGARRVPSLEPPPLPTSEVRALWVVRDSLTSPASIRSVVDQAVAGGFNTLFVQVRGRGDAYYVGAEPRAEALRGQPESFDPLQQLLAQARAANLQVHAWINVNLVSSAVTLPAARDHIVNRHPEWLMVPRALAQEFAITATGLGHVGRLARWTRAQPDLEGLYLSPIVPGAATYTVSVITELVRRYPLDGVHLDYIRYPAPEFDYSRAALEAFAAAVAPTLPSPERARLSVMANDDVLAWVDAYPDRWTEFRRSRLTALVMRVRSAIRAERPNLVLSAAVTPDAEEAATQRLQDWQLWAESGLLDVVCPMAYTPDLDLFKRQIGDATALAGRTAIWAGIGAYRLTPAQTAAHIEAARAAGARGIVLFSYDKMVERPASGYLDALRKAAFHPTRTVAP